MADEKLSFQQMQKKTLVTILKNRRKEKLKYKVLSLLFVLTLSIILFSSCKKENDFPDYYGSWVTKKVKQVGNGYFEASFNLNISKDEFIETFVDYPTEISYKCVYVKGSILINGSFMNFIPNEISFSLKNYNDNPYANYTSDDEKFLSRFAGLQNIVSWHTAEFEFTGNELILKIKHPGWEEYPEYFETVTYTRP